MNILKVKIDKFKKLEDFEANFDGHHVLLLGDNEVGKSTLIQFLQIALGDQKHVPPGAEGSGEVIITKDGNELTCSVEFNKDGNAVLNITGKGVSIDNKKSAIANLFGINELDVFEFVELSKSTAGRKKQIEIVKSFYDQDTKNSLAYHEANIKNDYDERTSLNKLIKEKETAIKLNDLYSTTLVDIKRVYNDETKKTDIICSFPKEGFAEINIDNVYEQLKAAQKINENVVKVEEGIKDKQSKISEHELKIKALKAEIEGIELHKANLETDIKNGQVWLQTNTKKDISSFEETIKGATLNNNRYALAMKLKTDIETVEKMKDEAGELTVKIDSSKEAIANTVREIGGPIDNLGYDDETLLWNGVPVNPDSLSTSQIMELGVRLKMAENPDLGILFIPRGESLGLERKRVIKEMADTAGWQIIMEQVQEGTEELTIQIMAD